VDQAGELFTIKRTVTGLGLFATKGIAKGTRIIEYTGPYISNEKVDENNGKYYFGIDSKWSIDGSPRSNTARYINHSCAPNAEALVSNRRVWIWSKRDIKPGEEITYDYGKEYFKGIIEQIGCRCVKCRAERRRRKARAKRARKSRRAKSTSASGNNPRARAPEVAPAKVS